SSLLLLIPIIFSTFGVRISWPSLQTAKSWRWRPWPIPCAFGIWSVAASNWRTSQPTINMIQCVVFSSDGRTLASAGSDSTIILWNAATGQRRLQLHRQEGNTIISLAFTPEGKYLASSSTGAERVDQTVRLWDTATGKELQRYEVPMASIGEHEY